MTVPWTIDRDSDNPILKVNGSIDKEMVDNIPRIPAQNTEVLEKRQINGFNLSSYFSQGVPVAIRYEITGELQYNSGYIIESVWNNTDGLWNAKLYPTHGGAQVLYGKQGTKYRSSLILSRPQIGAKVRGGAEMTLAPISPEYIIEDVLGGVETVVSHSI